MRLAEGWQWPTSQIEYLQFGWITRSPPRNILHRINMWPGEDATAAETMQPLQELSRRTVATRLSGWF